MEYLRDQATTLERKANQELGQAEEEFKARDGRAYWFSLSVWVGV